MLNGMFSIYEMGMGYLFYYMNPTFFLFIVLYLLNLRSYIIVEDKEMTTRVIKKMLPHIFTPCMKYTNGRDVPTGFFIGYKYIGYLDNTNHDCKISIITTLENYKELVKYNEVSILPEIKSIVEETDSKITVYIRKGTYKNMYYQPMKLDMGHIQPIGEQKQIVSNIIDVYSTQGRASIFIHGVTFAGKSTIGYLLAKQLRGVYCHSFNPSEPGDQLSSLIMDMHHDEPLIIVIEEADIIIKSIHNNTIKTHLEYQTAVYNKSTWSSFMDDMVFYKNIILILTSNMSKIEIDALDESYLRKGRIHASYSMLEKIIL